MQNNAKNTEFTGYKLLIFCLMVFLVCWVMNVALWYIVTYAFNFWTPARTPLSWRSAVSDSFSFALVEAVSIPFVQWIQRRGRAAQEPEQSRE